MPPPSELGEFLRSRRERISPAEVGLPSSGRRRTPGLRREEVATLAGLSIDYLVRLEQGRDTNPSSEVIAALARALHLDDDERMHLKKLAVITNSSALCPERTALSTSVHPTVRVLLERLDPTPAFVVGPYRDVLAWNPAWAALTTPMGLLDRPVPNLAHYVFLDARARAVYPDWDVVADEQVNELRDASIRWADDRPVGLLDELSDDPGFADRWSAHGVAVRRRGVHRLAHPELGELRLAFEVLVLADEDQRLVTWLPADAGTTAALARHVPQPVSPAQLRVVGDD